MPNPKRRGFLYNLTAVSSPVSEHADYEKAPQSLIMIAATVPAINGVAIQPSTILIRCEDARNATPNVAKTFGALSLFKEGVKIDLGF